MASPETTGYTPEAPTTPGAVQSITFDGELYIIRLNIPNVGVYAGVATLLSAAFSDLAAKLNDAGI